MRVLARLAMPMLLLAACDTTQGDCRATFAPGWTLFSNDTGQGSMHVKNDNKWCAVGITSPMAGMDGKIVEDATHGTARVLRQPDRLVIGYLPVPGFAGGDRFKVQITPGYAHLLMRVTVYP